MKATSSTTSTASGRFNGLDPFDYHPLGRVVFQPGGLARLGELAREFGRRPLVVTDPGLKAAGHPQRAVAVLREAGLEPRLFDEVEENPTTRHVGLGVQAAQDHRADLLVAIGGGSAMDVAKGINFLVTNGGSMTDYRGFGRATKPMLPSLGVPTTAGTGSEAQSYALISDDKHHLKMACGDRKVAFRVALLDPELTLTQPATVTAVTGIDSIAHAVESYVCTRANGLSRMFAEQAWRLLSENFARVADAPGDLDARAGMQLGAYLAGAAIESSMLGAAHSCANPLTAHYGITHGIAVGVMLPHVVRFNAQVMGPQYAALAGSVDRILDVIGGGLARAGLPTSLGQLGVSPSILPLLAEEAAQQWTAQFNPRPVTERDLLQLYQAAT